jgi:hypothetical protein
VLTNQPDTTSWNAGYMDVIVAGVQDTLQHPILARDRRRLSLDQPLRPVAPAFGEMAEPGLTGNRQANRKWLQEPGRVHFGSCQPACSHHIK